jgi:peptidoglycan hydrolase-like protein with peptidoglycan-binding domain
MDYTVNRGECFSAIVHRFGFSDPQKVWDLPQNKELRDKRKTFNVLHPGDVIFIPQREDKKEPLTPGKKQNIQVSVPKKKLHLVLLDAQGKPVADTDYELKLGSQTLKGKTDGKGTVDQSIPATVTTAELLYGKRKMTLNIGALPPVDDTPDDGLAGIQARLRNLGLLVDEVEGYFCDRTRKAVKDFQSWFDHEVTGVVDDKFRQLLDLVHSNQKKLPDKKPGAKTSTEKKSGGGGAPPSTLGVEEKDALPEVPALCTTEAKKKEKAKKKQESSVAANVANLLKPARKGTCDKCEAYSDCLDNDYNFLLSVAHLAQTLDGEASNFMAIMHFETGHTFSASVKNSGSGATGLIQIMPSTAPGLGTTTDDLADMCRIQQLDYVLKYFKGVKNQYKKADFTELTDVVLAVFEPVGLDPDYEVLGVDADKCTGGPFVDVDGEDVEATDDRLAYYKKHGTKKDNGILKDDSGQVVGISAKRAKKKYYRATYDGDELKVTPHMRAVYSGNSGLDKDKDGFILRTDYPALLGDGITKNCGKDSCAKASELQKQLQSKKLIIVTDDAK